MNDLLHLASIDIARFLDEHLPRLSDDWWNQHVVNRLSFPQQRRVEEHGLSSLEELDVAALIRLLDQNWYELSQATRLPREARSWVKELGTARNRWAHQSAQKIPPGEFYRDADTLGRLLNVLDPGSNTLAKVEAAKHACVSEMSGSGSVSPRPEKTDLSRHTNDSSDPKSTSQGSQKSSESGTKPTKFQELMRGVASIRQLPIDLQPISPMPPHTNDSSDPSPAAELTDESGNESLFRPGDLVTLHAGPSELLPVLEVIPGGGECSYVVLEGNEKKRYFETQLVRADETEPAPARLGLEALHAYLTSLKLLSPSASHLFSLRSGRVQFVPYQYQPVLRLLRADRPRLLIADEVGVGKTIEAGLIIKELRARTDISSVLIACPKSLVAERKWLVEMKRFDEHFTHIDGPLLRHCLNETHLDGEWPRQYSKAIIPFSLFDSNLLFGAGENSRLNGKGLLELDPPLKFDLVIVDEAHYLRNPETFQHQGLRYLCENAEAVVFLTATPVQMGSNDLFTLLNILRPDLVIDHPSFEHMAEPNPPINKAIAHCRAAQEGWEHEAQKCLNQVAETRWGQLFLCDSPSFQSIYDQLVEGDIDDPSRIGLIRELEEIYTFSPMINRTRRRDIGTFTTRKPETLKIDFSPDQRRLHDDVLQLTTRILATLHGEKNLQFMTSTLRRQVASCIYGLAPMLKSILHRKLERFEVADGDAEESDFDLGFVDQIRSEIEALLGQASHLDPSDPKLEAFLNVLRTKNSMPKNKSLVFSTFRHTLAYLEKHLKAENLRFGLVHGGVPDEERAELRRRFSLPREDPHALDVLLSSEVGCEGLDFQYCDLLVNYDLPWNPMRIEQRIGRIDRFGQESETVAIVNLITPDTVDAEIYNRCLLRIGVFQRAVGGSEAILGEITQEIHDIAENFSLTSGERTRRLRQLGDTAIREIQDEQELEEKQAELFGLAVPSQSWGAELDAAESFWLSERSLERCVSAYLASALGAEGEFILGEKPLKTLRLNQDSRGKLLEDFKLLPRSIDPVSRQWEKWLKGPEPMMPVTFDQETASTETGVPHLNVLHPLVRQAAASLPQNSPVQTELQARSNEIPAGRYPFAIHRWHKVGARPDELLVAISTEPALEDHLMGILTTAEDSSDQKGVDSSAREALDLRHYQKWSAARANHIAENRETVQHRIQSLEASHRARCAQLEDQIRQATDSKIRRMREHELERAQLGYERQVAGLQESAERADIHASMVVSGTIDLRAETEEWA